MITAQITDLKQNPIRRIIHHLNNPLLSSPLTRHPHIIQAEISNPSRIDHRHDLSELERFFSVRGTPEAPFADGMDVLDGDGEAIDLDVWTVAADFGCETTAGICWFLVFVEAGVGWPLEDEVGCCEGGEKQGEQKLVPHVICCVVVSRAQERTFQS